MREFNCIDPSQQIRGHYFLEASAGTGKTFAIEHSIVRLIAEGGVPPERILAVTFTKAATRDLKKRVRASLEKAHAALQSRHFPPEYRYLDDVDADKRIREALRGFEKLHVYTIHGFCYQMLIEHALLSSIPLDSREEERGDYFVEQHILDAIRRFVKPPLLSPFQYQMLLKQSDVQRLVRKMLPLVTSPSITLPEGYTFADFKKEAGEVLSKITDPDKLAEAVRYHAPYYSGLCTRQGVLREVFEMQLSDIASASYEKMLLWGKPLFAFFTDKQKKQKKTIPPIDQEIEFMRDRFAPLVTRATDWGSIFATLCHRVRAYVRSELDKRELLLPDRILEKMDTALDTPAMRLAVRKQFDAVIIDEFQDTDPVQWAIFSKLFFSEEYKVPTLYLVGDPKQSIYSFRNADIYTYLRAKRSFSSEAIASLATNYRSDASLVRALNALFAHPQVASLLRLPQEHHSVPFVPVKSGKPDPAAPQRRPICVFEAPSDGSDQVEERFFIPYIAAEIQRLHTEEDIAYSSFAVIVSDRFQARRVHRCCTSLGIPVSMRNAQTVTEAPVFSLLKQLHSIMKDPFDMRSIKRLCVHPLLGFDYRIFLDGERWHRLVAHLQKLHVYYKTSSWHAALAHFLQTPLFEKGRSPLELFVEGKNKEPYTDLMQLLDLLNGGYTLEQLERMGKRGDPLVEKTARGSEEAISIITMHMSKGLEFDIVFALGIVSARAVKEPLLRCGNDFVYNTIDSPQCKTAVQEMEAEKLRQFYVTVTRAKEKLYIPSCKDKGGNAPLTLFLGEHGEEVWRSLEAEGHIDRVRLETPPCPESIAESSDMEDIPPVLELPACEYKTAQSFSMLARPQAHDSPDLPEGALPPGSETGIHIHSVFEHLIETAAYKEDFSQSVYEKLAPTFLSGFSEEVHRMVLASFTRALPTNYGDIVLRELPPEYMLPEVAFSYEEDGVVKKGVIDLLFYAHGRWFVLDWKTTYSSGYTQEALEETMTVHDYFLQGAMYASAARKFLGGRAPFGGVLYLFLRGILHPREGVYYYEP